jgi:4-pyridoxolactonase
MVRIVKIYLLDLGSLVIDRSDVLWHIDVGTPVRFPVYGVYIDHPEGKFVFDTGYDLDHVNKVLPFELPEQTPEQTLPAQLEKCGAKPEDIDFVINSHFHFDHVGGNKYLTNATLLTSKMELRSSLVPEPFERLGYSDLTFYTRGVTKVEYLEGDTEIAKGLTLFETPGHTIAHYSLLAEPEGRRPMIFAGDAAYSHETLDRMIIGGFHLDPVDSISALKRIKSMAKKHDAEIFVSHEMAPWLEWKHAPESYGA